MRPILVLLFLAAPLLSADLYLRKTGETTWEEFTSLGDLQYGEHLILRVHSDGDNPNPPIDPPPETGLPGKISAAAKSANDPESTVELRDLYSIAVTMMDNGLDLLSVRSLVVQGEEKILEDESATAWASFRALTKKELFANPMPPKTVREIHVGLKDAAGGANAKKPGWIGKTIKKPSDASLVTKPVATKPAPTSVAKSKPPVAARVQPRRNYRTPSRSSSSYPHKSNQQRN